MRRLAVQEPACRGDDAVAALFLHAGQAAQKFVGHVLAETGLAELGAVDGEQLAAQNCRLLRKGAAVLPDELEAGDGHVVDLAEVVIEARHLQPVPLRVDHAPPRKIVDGRAPQHRFLAAGIHRDVAADAASIRRGRIDGEREAFTLGGLADAPGDHPGLGEQHRALDFGARQPRPFNGSEPLEFLGIDHRGPGRERHGAARVTGAAAPRDHGEAERTALAHQVGNLRLGIGGEHQEGQLDAPVGRIRDVSNPGIAVEVDVVGPGVLVERAPRPLAQCDHLRKVSFETIHGGARGRHELRHLGRAVFGGGIAALLHFAQAVVQGFDELGAAFGIVDQIVLQERVTVHHPDVAQHLVEHARRPPGAPLGAQLLEQLPRRRAEQSNHDLTIGKRGVVVRDLAQPRRRAVRCRVG